MKFVKRSIYLLLAIAMVFSFNAAIEYETLAVEKMNDELLELMSWVSDTTPFSVMIELKDKVPQDKLKKALDEVYKEYDMDAFYASEKNYIGNDKAYEEDYPELLAHYDAYDIARREVLASFYYPHNYAFIEKYDLEVEKKEYVGSSTPYIHYIIVNKEIVKKMLYDTSVQSIVHYSSLNEKNTTDMIHPSWAELEPQTTVDDAMQYVRGDINDLGVMGNGIKVGLIESGTPDTNVLSGVTDLNGVDRSDPHATRTSIIIRLLSPNCEIFSYKVGSSTDTSNNNQTNCSGLTFSTLVTAAFEALTDPEGPKVDVVNMSYAHLYEDSSIVASQNCVTRCLDKIIKQHNTPLVVAASNANLNSSSNLNFNVSNYATGYNSICVGGISAPGTAIKLRDYFEYHSALGNNPSSVDPSLYFLNTSGCEWTKRGRMEMYIYSCWREPIDIPNKPELVAPAGLFYINSETADAGTSYAAPHVTSTVAWMLARNVYMKGKTEQIRAAILGSAYTRQNQVDKITINDNTSGSANWTSDFGTNGSASSDYYGAGVLNAAYCYNVAYLGQRAQFTFTAAGQQKSYNVSVSNNGLPFRIAIAWSATPDSNSSNYNLIRNKYSITISKPGVSGSTITYQQLRNLHQEITLTPAMISNYGGGTYTVTVTCLEYNVSNDIVGMAWNNINPLGYAPFNAQ